MYPHVCILDRSQQRQVISVPRGIKRIDLIDPEIPPQERSITSWCQWWLAFYLGLCTGTWASSRHSGWVSRTSIPRNDNQRLPAPVGQAVWQWDSRVGTGSLSHTVGRTWGMGFVVVTVFRNAVCHDIPILRGSDCCLKPLGS